MKLTVDITRQDRNWLRREPAIEKLTTSILKATLKHVDWPKDAPRTEISVVYTSDAEVQVLNAQWRGKDKPTNVLSFPQFEGFVTGDKNPVHLGDIIFAYQTVSREAKEQGKTFRAHLTHLLIHGLLHLLGYDHETAKDAAKMEKLEIHIMQSLGYTNPYEIA